MNLPNRPRPAASNFRWVICALLFFSTTVNYMDRQVISYLKEFFCTATDQGGFGWTNSDFANVTTVFTGFYAGMTILAGWVIDKIGTKLGLALSLIVWSVFGILNAFVGSLTWMHMIIRSAFGIGEAGNFPASIKTVAEWFPKRERALATGIFNSGSNVGAMISALFVPWCLIHFGDQQGWKMAFIFTGAIGFLWLIFWFWLYAPPGQHKGISKAEFDYIHSDRDETKADELQDDKSAKQVSGSLISFRGRMSATEFTGLTSMIIFLCLFVYFISRMFPGLSATGATILYGIVGASALWVSLAAQAKRWHDLGKPTWFLALNLLPGVGTIISILILATRPSTSGANQFGDAAKSGLLAYRQTWAFFFGKFFTDGIWWFYLFWLPDYLKKQFGMTKHEIMLPTFIVYGIAIIGSVYGGSIPMTLMKRGMAVYQARMTAMFIIALFPLTVLSTQYFGNIAGFGTQTADLLKNHLPEILAKHINAGGVAAVTAIAVICIGAAAHQAWSANLFTTVSDMFPKKSVGSVTGIGAMAGGLGGVIIQKLAGTLTDAFKENPQHAYLIMFVVCALSYLTAWGFMKAFVPRHKPITDL
jgi:MFS family permease